MRPPDGTAPYVGIFSTSAYYSLRPDLAKGFRRFEASEGRALASVGGVLEGSVFHSGRAAPYAGVDVRRPREPLGVVVRLVDDLLAQVESAGARTVRIDCKPAPLSSSEDPVRFALLRQGFRVASSDIGYHIDLRQTPTPDEYVAALRPPARRALRAGWDEYDAREARDAAEWAVGFGVIEENRRRKGYGLRLSLEYVERLRDLFPDAIRLMTLWRSGLAVAAALRYRVHPDVDLVVYWGDVSEPTSPSPMNRLAYEVVKDAAATGAAVVDLGPISVDGTPNEGLARFKVSVLGRPSLRLSLALDA